MKEATTRVVETTETVYTEPPARDAELKPGASIISRGRGRIGCGPPRPTIALGRELALRTAERQGAVRYYLIP